MGRLGRPELIIILFMGVLTLATGSLPRRIGVRTLTFKRTSDIFIALGIVAAFLVTFLILSHQ